MSELERITARRSELDALAEELGKRLGEVEAEREELVIAERVLHRLAGQDRAEVEAAARVAPVKAQVAGRAVLLNRRRLGNQLPDCGVVVLGDLASALLRGGDVDRGVYVSRQFAAAAQTKPNTMGKERAAAIAASLPNSEQELAFHPRQFAS
ncbi:hypothetical protein ACGFS9_22910 [Streptomyces sp. NPDC048566]|uniref:hypothetical protein n=1 Tax=Streptomyces sp. NPDC048566 TaxID=3365569 RepID=UPI0037172099